MKKILKVILGFLICFWVVGQVQVIIDILEDIKQNTTQEQASKRSLNHIDTPEEIPEVVYNTYYLLSWTSSNGTFIAEGSLNYTLNEIWNFNSFPADTIFISTHDNNILTLDQFKENYAARSISLARIDNSTIVPYIQTQKNGIVENYNILLSLSSFLYNTNFRYLNIYNNVGTYTISTYWSVMNADNTIDNEFIIQWGQPTLLVSSDTFTHHLNTSLSLQAFMQPISIKISSGTAIELAYKKGYEDASSNLTGMTIFKEVLKVGQKFLDLNLYQGITIGLLVAVPVIISIVLWFINLWR